MVYFFAIFVKVWLTNIFLVMDEIEVIISGISDLLRPSTSHALILEEVCGNESKRRLAMIIVTVKLLI